MPIAALAQCTVTNASGCVCKVAGQTDCDLLPDITISWKALESYAGGPNEYAQNDPSNPGRLRVTGSTPNIGRGTLNVRGVDQNGFRWFVCGSDTASMYDPNSTMTYNGCSNAKQLIFQRIYHKNGAAMTFTERFAGTMTYHASHGHNHVDDWATFTLRSQTPGEPDARLWPIIGSGAKVGFCLMDFYPCSSGSAVGHCRTSQEYGGGTALNANGDFPNYGLGGGNYNCSQVSQGISVGYTDVYSESLDGMWVNIPPGTCNGNYWVVMEVDPRNNFIEENENNNWTAAPVTLTQQVPSGGDFSFVTPSTNTTLCAGSPITLTATQGSSYLWSNGATTRTISPTQSGSYSCTVTSTCGTDDSPAVSVNFLSASQPVGTGATIPGPGTASLSATGADVRWFAAPSGGTSLGSGNSFVTPSISATTTYHAENRVTQPGSTTYTGKTTNTGGGAYNTLDQHLVFDAFQPIVLKSVKVYSQSAGNRTFQVLSSSGSLITQATVNVPNGESRVTLNLNVPMGNDLRLKVTTAYIDMYRNDGGVSYPYNTGGLVSVKGSSAGAQYYYYCYDWEVASADLVCTSARTPVTATVASGVVLSLKALLEGPFNSGTGLMTDSLRVANLIPFNEPYSALGFTQAGGGGGESIANSMLTTSDNNAVVDWVLVELRSSTSPATIVATQCGVITRVGQVLSTTGANMRFGVPDGNYHVAIRHRNHLGTMTAAPVALSATPMSLDLSLSSTATWGTNGRKTVGAYRVLWAGEAVKDGVIMYTGAGNDRDNILSRIGGIVATNVVSGYFTSDINMDGRVKYTGGNNDRDPILLNIGGVVPTNTIVHQLP